MGKASLTVHTPKAVTGGYVPGDSLPTIDFHFNPKELSFSKSAKWSRPPAKTAQTAAKPEFHGAEPTKLSLEMFLDVSRAKGASVVETVELLLNCCIPIQKTIQELPQPPLVIFHWGKIHSVPMYISQVSAKYTRFAADGTPIRATCNVSMEEMPAEPQATNPTSGSTGVRGEHLLREGDTLTSIAYREYQDPSRWRAIADVNGIDDPLRVRPGTTILLPRPDELRAST